MACRQAVKAVLDVGQFVSATINRQGHPAQILRAWRGGTFELVTSLSILEDLRRVLHYPHIRRRHGLTDAEIDAFVEAVALATMAPAEDLDENVIREDPSDDKILACALAAHADYIVASDAHLTRLDTFRGIQIVLPRRFLEILAEERVV